jgi:hypothetical protein
MFERILNGPSPFCPQCGLAMKLNRTLPELGSRPKLHIFECSDCKEFVTRTEESNQQVIDWDHVMLMPL